ncbi:Red chlorophyll catabolite reductase [Dichanthelium oligosanthes]|uniref:Red chlorophyll catabolite reductase n=1 Tax=Dichanthelium oligosanthes TaxID=888268 RepID=A0A1E5WD73_9POAL|nr:Red chlorophyll catabolite reductase [Dichanthelium oligosanthes]
MMATLPAPSGHHRFCGRSSPPAAAPIPRSTSGRRSLRGRSSSSTCRGTREAAVARMPRLAHREVMLTLAREAEARLGGQLLPSEVPADVTWFGDGAAIGSVDVRRGAPGSSIDFMLEAWFHRTLPTGGAIDITSLIVFLNGATDAPHFVMELIQGGPSSLVVLLDLFPRRDLPLHPDYIDKYYDATGVDNHRQSIARIPQVRPYVSPSLLVRSLWSPTAVIVDVQCGERNEGVLEEIVRSQLASSAMAALDVWLEHCAGSVVEMEAAERDSLVARDKTISTTSVKRNLSANLPKMFDNGVSDRVVAQINKAFLGS